MNPGAAILIVLIAVLALAMVYAMVQWSLRLLQAPLPRAGEPLIDWTLGGREARRWGTAYAILWLALVGAFLALFAALGDDRPVSALAFLLAVAAGWIGLNVLFVWFGRALARTGERSAREGGRERREAVTDVSVAGLPERSPASRAGGAVRRVAGMLAPVAWIGGIILLAALGRAWRPLRNLETWFQAHRSAWLVPLGILALLGLALFIGGAVAMVLGQGTPMSHEEIEELERRRLRWRLGPGLARWVAVRVPAIAVGAEAGDSASFAEVKAAFRARAWEVSPRWRRLFVVMLGSFLLVAGLFGAAVVIAPAGLKPLFAGALIYAAVRLAWGFARA